jgi:phosphatidylinositol alpha-mannosyltransferase
MKPAGAARQLAAPGIEEPAPRAMPPTREAVLGTASAAAAPPDLAVPSLAPRRRIALVTEYYHPHVGGIPEHVCHFAREARRRGHVVQVITSHLPGGERSPDIVRIGESVTVRANGSLARLTVGRGLRTAMRDALRRGRFDVVHVHQPLTPSLPMMAIEEAECPVVGTFHAYFEFSVAYGFGRRYFQRLMDRLDAAVAVSAAARDATARYFDADWTIIPNGVDTGTFEPGAPRPALLGDGVPTVLFVGRFDSRNGLPALIEAFRLVRASGRRARLLVVGDGPQRDRYHRLAAGDADIVFAGHVPSGLPGYYAGSAVYACPAVLGSFGITLLEAMACGAPIVCYDTPGFRTLVRDDAEALMTPPRDVPALARAIGRVLDDGALRRRLGAAGRERARTFAWPVVADAVLALYDRVLATVPSAAHGRRRAS